MPNQEHERERERDQTHSYWYIPSAPRVNYSLLVMESAGMMKMATGEGCPLRQGAKTGSREVFGGYRGLRRRNSRSIVLLDVSVIWIYIGERSRSGESRGAHETGGMPRGVGAPSYVLASSKHPWLVLQVSRIMFVPKITLTKVSFHLDSV